MNMRYSKILSKVIKTAKMFHHNNKITHSNNKIKAMWNIMKSETGGNDIKYDKVNVCNIDKEYDKSVNAEGFNKYFLTLAESISCKITGNNKQITNYTKYSLSYLSQIFNLPFTNIVFCNISTVEIENLFTPSFGKTRVVMMK